MAVNVWVSPTGYNDPNGSWNGEQYAYDGSVDPPIASSSIPAHSWSNFLELTIEAIYCSKIEFYATYHGTNGINSIDLDVYYSGSWHDVYQGSFLNHVWVEKTNELTPPQYVTKMRMRFYNNSSSVMTAQITEAMFYQIAGIPILTTNAATLVGSGKATLNGEIIDTGGVPCTTRGFKYCEEGGAEQDVNDAGAFAIGVYSENLTELNPTKKYYFLAYATNTAGTGYGNWLSFGESVAIPTVTSSAATLVDFEEATLNGNITATGGQDPTERGFQWKIGVDGDIETLPETGVFGIGAYTLLLDELEASVNYYFRAYAKNDAGTAYGTWLNFYTDLTNPTVVTHNATDELTTQVTGNGEIVKTGGMDCDERGFEYGLTKTPTWNEKESAGGYGVGFFDLTIDGLQPNTEYWYRAWVKILTAFNVSIATYNNKYKAVGDQDSNPYDIFIKADGSMMYMFGRNLCRVNQYTLSIPWDISTASYNSKYKQLNIEDNNPTRIYFSSDGTKLYVVGLQFKTIFQYTLSIPWDISTASYDTKSFNISGQDAEPHGIYFSSDGLKMYMAGRDSGKIYQYILTTKWDISTASYDSKYKNVNSETALPANVFFLYDGLNMFVMGEHIIYQYMLTTPWDVSTASYESKSFDTATQSNGPFGISFKADGSMMYIMGNYNKTIYQYSIVITGCEGGVIGYGEWVKFVTAAEGVIPSGYKNDICSDYNGYTYILNRSLKDDGADYESYFVLSTDLSGEKTLHTNKRLLDLFSYFANKGSGTADIYVKRNNEPDWQYAGEVSLAGEEEIIIKHLPVDYLAKTFLIKFVFENDFEFVGIITEAVPIGDRP